VVEMKKSRIKNELASIVDNENYLEYLDMAGDVLSGLPPDVAMASLLRLAFKSELEESNYPEIRSINVDRRGTARLFISFGRLDGYNPKKLTELLKRECGLKDSKIDDVKVSDSYSFVTVPFSEAKEVIATLNRLSRGDRPVAEIAQDNNKNAGGEKSPKGENYRKQKSAGSSKPEYGGGGKSRRDGYCPGSGSGSGPKDGKSAAGGAKPKKHDDFSTIQWDATADMGRKSGKGKKSAGWGGKSGFDKRTAPKNKKGGRRGRS
jgi:ATP-dependent RNA helicase DeaD